MNYVNVRLKSNVLLTGYDKHTYAITNSAYIQFGKAGEFDRENDCIFIVVS